jgi:hypothetical protein
MIIWGAGVLFTKINMDTFGDVLAGAFADLDDLLSRAPVARGGNGEARRSDAMLMQLAAMCMFVAWNINYAPPDQRPGCVADLPLFSVSLSSLPWPMVEKTLHWTCRCHSLEP